MPPLSVFVLINSSVFMETSDVPSTINSKQFKTSLTLLLLSIELEREDIKRMMTLGRCALGERYWQVDGQTSLLWMRGSGEGLQGEAAGRLGWAGRSCRGRPCLSGEASPLFLQGHQSGQSSR